MNSGVHAVLSGVLVPPAWPFKHKDAIFASSRASADGRPTSESRARKLWRPARGRSEASMIAIAGKRMHITVNRDGTQHRD
jgi:hypothetical protein